MESITYGFDGAFTTYIFENDTLELYLERASGVKSVVTQRKY